MREPAMPRAAPAPAPAPANVPAPCDVPAGDRGGDIPDRRRSPRRRLRDRIASLERAESPVLASDPAVATLKLLVEDDLRQTALALGAVEAFLQSSMRLLESRELTAAALRRHGNDDAVLEHLESVSQNLASLRRRMISIAAAMGPHRRGDAF